MFSITKLFLSLNAVYGLEVTPSNATIKQGLEEEVTNPLFENINAHGLVPVRIITIFANPKHIEAIAQIPAWLFTVAQQQAGTSNAQNDKKYSLFTETAIEKFPGTTGNPDDKVHHHNTQCEVVQVGECPDGYKKINLDDFRQRTKDEMASLLPGNNHRSKGTGNKVVLPDEASSQTITKDQGSTAVVGSEESTPVAP